MSQIVSGTNETFIVFAILCKNEQDKKTGVYDVIRLNKFMTRMCRHLCENTYGKYTCSFHVDCWVSSHM